MRSQECVQLTGYQRRTRQPSVYSALCASGQWRVSQRERGARPACGVTRGSRKGRGRGGVKEEVEVQQGGVVVGGGGVVVD